MFGKLTKNGKIVGYRVSLNDVHKEQIKERKLKAEVTTAHIQEAEIALEVWAFWRYEAVGFGDSNSNINDRGRLPACSRPPFGIELLHNNDRVMVAFAKMQKIDSKHREYVRIIQSVYAERKTKEPISKLFNRLDFGFSKRQFIYARKRFAQLFS